MAEKNIALPDNPVAGLVEPNLSQALESLVRTVLNPHPAVAGHALEVASWQRSEARRHLGTFDRLCAPVGERQMRAWLMALSAGVRNPMSEGDLALRLAAVMIACGDIPVRVVSRASLREAMQKFEFMPSVADLAALWREPALELRARRDALRKISAAPDEPRGVEMSLEEREAVLARHRENMAAQLPSSVDGGAVAAGGLGRAPEISRATLEAIYTNSGLRGPSV